MAEPAEEMQNGVEVENKHSKKRASEQAEEGANDAAGERKKRKRKKTEGEGADDGEGGHRAVVEKVKKKRKEKRQDNEREESTEDGTKRKRKKTGGSDGVKKRNRSDEAGEGEDQDASGARKEKKRSKEASSDGAEVAKKRKGTKGSDSGNSKRKKHSDSDRKGDDDDEDVREKEREKEMDEEKDADDTKKKKKRKSAKRAGDTEINSENDTPHKKSARSKENGEEETKRKKKKKGTSGEDNTDQHKKRSKSRKRAGSGDIDAEPEKGSAKAAGVEPLNIADEVLPDEELPSVTQPLSTSPRYDQEVSPRRFIDVGGEAVRTKSADKHYESQQQQVLAKMEDQLRKEQAWKEQERMLEEKLNRIQQKAPVARVPKPLEQRAGLTKAELRELEKKDQEARAARAMSPRAEENEKPLLSEDYWKDKADRGKMTRVVDLSTVAKPDVTPAIHLTPAQVAMSNKKKLSAEDMRAQQQAQQEQEMRQRQMRKRGIQLQVGLNEEVSATMGRANTFTDMLYTKERVKQEEREEALRQKSRPSLPPKPGSSLVVANEQYQSSSGGDVRANASSPGRLEAPALRGAAQSAPASEAAQNGRVRGKEHREESRESDIVSVESSGGEGSPELGRGGSRILHDEHTIRNQTSKPLPPPKTGANKERLDKLKSWEEKQALLLEKQKQKQDARRALLDL